MTARTALVTGGGGFLGAHLCMALLNRGHTVCCVDNFLTSQQQNIAFLEQNPRFTFVRADVSEPFELKEKYGLVFHLASPASPSDYLRLPIQTMRVNSLGTERMLIMARQWGARFVLASTSECYGDPKVHPQGENYWGNVNPVGPRSVYDEAKRYAEALTTAYQSAYGVDAVIARIFNTYGPHMKLDDGRAVPSFISRALQGRPMSVTGDGSQTRSLCYVDDTVAGLLAIADSDQHSPINIGNPEEVSILELARRIRSAANSLSEIQFSRAVVDDPKRRCPDIALITGRTGWKPTIDLDTGIRQTTEWFREQMQGRRHLASYDKPVCKTEELGQGMKKIFESNADTGH